MFNEKDLVEYLQSQMNNFQEELKKFGPDDRIVVRKFDAMIANKEMVEAVIGKPVNLGKDGKVTVGQEESEMEKIRTYVIGETEYELYRAASGDYCVTGRFYCVCVHGDHGKHDAAEGHCDKL